MNLNWVPSTAKGESPTMAGEVVVRLPSYPERVRIQARFAEFAGTKEEEKRHEKMLAIADIADTAKTHLVSVKLSMLDGSVAVNSADELYSMPQFDGVVTELALGLLNGFSGNSQGRSEPK